MLNIESRLLDHDMHHYFMQFSADEKNSVLQMIKTFLKGKTQESGHISIEQYNKELDEAEREIEEGKFVTQKALEKEMEKWQ